jgi:hypothetical protein
VNIPFKILLLLVNAPGYLLHISDTDENIKVMFLSPNNTSLFYPMDQGIIATFKELFSGGHSSNWLRT